MVFLASERNNLPMRKEWCMSECVNEMSYQEVDFLHYVSNFCGNMNLTNYCNICGKTDNIFPCIQCNVLYYCSKEHQVRDWPTHKCQCMELSHCKEDISALRCLKFNNRLAMLTVSPSSLCLITNWFSVWKHVGYITTEHGIFKRFLSELLSWPLIMMKSILNFRLETKEKLQIHILGASSSYINPRLFSYFLTFFSLPTMEIFLIGRQLSHHGCPLEFENATGKDGIN